MENFVGSAIEKIKLQEINTEAKLKEKRELDATVSSLNRSVRETISLIEKSEQDQAELAKSIDKLRCQVQIEKIRRDAMLAQIDSYRKELDELKNKSDDGISKVWSLRSSLCDAVQKLSDDCDIWALLMKPVLTESLPQVKNTSDNIDRALVYEQRLKEAMERREKALAERERLLNEPESGEEFVRIKNALKYSVEKVDSLRNN